MFEENFNWDLLIHELRLNLFFNYIDTHYFGLGKAKNGDNNSSHGSFNHLEKDGRSQYGEEGSSGTFSAYIRISSHPITALSPLSGLPEFSHFGWGHWFTLRDLEVATNYWF